MKISRWRRRSRDERDDYISTCNTCASGLTTKFFPERVRKPVSRDRVHTSGLVDAGGRLPVVIIFVDLEEHVIRVLAKLFELTPHRLIVRENVVIEQGSLD